MNTTRIPRILVDNKKNIETSKKSIDISNWFWYNIAVLLLRSGLAFERCENRTLIVDLVRSGLEPVPTYILMIHNWL